MISTLATPESFMTKMQSSAMPELAPIPLDKSWKNLRSFWKSQWQGKKENPRPNIYSRFTVVGVTKSAL